MRAFHPILLAAGALCVAGCAPVGDCYTDTLDHPSCTAPADPPKNHLRDYRNPDRMTLMQMDPSPVPKVGDAIPTLHTLTVTGVDEYLEPGATSPGLGNIWVEERFVDPDFTGCPRDEAGNNVCGMQIFGATTVPSGTHLLVGDIVDVSGGTYDEFNCGTCSSQFTAPNTLPEFDMSTIQRTGSAASPAPVPVTLAQLISGGDLYRNVLVRVTDDVTLGTRDVAHANFTLNSQIQLSTELTDLTDPATGMPLASGVKLHNLVGIASYFFKIKIIVRSSADYEVVP